jgi:hypothetical protein
VSPGPVALVRDHSKMSLLRGTARGLNDLRVFSAAGELLSQFPLRRPDKVFKLAWTTEENVVVVFETAFVETYVRLWVWLWMCGCGSGSGSCSSGEIKSRVGVSVLVSVEGCRISSCSIHIVTGGWNVCVRGRGGHWDMAVSSHTYHGLVFQGAKCPLCTPVAATQTPPIHSLCTTRGKPPCALAAATHPLQPPQPLAYKAHPVQTQPPAGDIDTRPWTPAHALQLQHSDSCGPPPPLPLTPPPFPAPKHPTPAASPHGHTPGPLLQPRP